MANARERNKLPALLKEYESLRRPLFFFQVQHFRTQNNEKLMTFSDEHVTDSMLSEANFDSCMFERCAFERVRPVQCTISDCEFIDCNFIDCDLSFSGFFNVLFKKTRFIAGTIEECTYSDVFFEDVEFKGCQDITEVRFGGCSYSNPIFSVCGLSYLTFDEKLDHKECDIFFKNCELSHNAFYWYTFKDATFIDSLLTFCSFNNCHLSPNTIPPNNGTTDTEFNSIDFQTILKSDILSMVLAKHFGIHSPDLKAYVMAMVSKAELHTFFISYSFSDKAFAKRLNEALKKRGVITFLWEKDAPPGQRLKKIISYNVQKFQKVLFIASHHSLKSEACHYELTKGRKKQDKDWELVLFPVHVDHFLFAVEQDDIPRNHRAEFWTNIEELREIHSMDLSPFTGETIDSVAFDQQIDKLIIGLKKEKGKSGVRQPGY